MTETRNHSRSRGPSPKRLTSSYVGITLNDLNDQNQLTRFRFSFTQFSH